MAHIFEVTLMEVRPLLGNEEIYQLVVSFQVLSTVQKQALSVLALLGEHGIHRVLVETVD